MPEKTHSAALDSHAVTTADEGEVEAAAPSAVPKPGIADPTSARLIGVIEANQTEKEGKTTPNHRLLAVATRAHTHSDVNTLIDLRPGMVDEIEHFFISYNQTQGKRFQPTARGGQERAIEIVRAGMERQKTAH